MYITKCPACNTEGELFVIGGIFLTKGMRLHGDGFSFVTAKEVDTEDETAQCRICRKHFSLDDLYRDEPPPNRDKFLKVKGD